ncbi:hypothetical protein RHSIM_Rhsim10G0061900 [Rhododendron simsii]|uniref:Uncharacterized protein n=1 Tax=Rhododendron simsii TaxID=118357 RepID=A0A834LCY0_RHOSS|nr:hypothetical protein RHSIM_Rhsim10G0061900 [Rhododendron simsii]
MPDPCTLTSLGRIGGPILANVGGCLVAPIQRQFNYMCCFNSNITELETQFEELETTRQGVQMGVDESRRNVRVIGPNVEAWLKSAKEVTSEVNGIIQDKPKVKEGCLNGWCPNLKLRYSLSKKAVKKTKVVTELKDAGIQYTQSSYSPPPPVPIPNRDFMGFESRRLNMEEIIKDLKHDEINLIGVCGMGGVGKTTLVNEVAKRAKEYNHFDEVAMAVVGQKPDLTNVQACIADMLGLKNLLDTKSPDVRANLLRTRLLQDNKKVLVILDDVWAEFDLKAMGIPLEGANKNFKMLYTSRTRDLWNDLRTKNEIPLEILSKDEAWQLFREKAGDSADVPDLQPIAKQIVNECGCLPLALVLIGSALSKKIGRNYTKEIWKGMLDRLACPRSTQADERLSSCLELSYEYLEDKEAKRLFLLCCLFKEDEDIRIEDLARYGLGLSLFDEIPEMEKVRSQVFLIVDDLKSRYLLLDSKEEEEEECVKVHDVVRDMGISIASKDKFALVSHGAISQWPKTATHEQYAISVISDEIEELPEGLTYPNLEFLMLRCQELEKLLPNFFEGMEKLKVLELPWFRGILTLKYLRNLTMLSLEGFCGTLDVVSLRLIGGIANLEILNFRYSKIEELPIEIGELVKLRLLDLRDTRFLTRIPPYLISSLVHLEELYFWGSNFIYWEGEQKEVRDPRMVIEMGIVIDLNTIEERNAKLSEFEFLSNLNTLEICIRSKSDAPIPKVPIFSKLNLFKVVIAYNVREVFIHGRDFLNEQCERVLWVEAEISIPLDGGGLDSLLRSSDWLHLEGRGCNDLVRDGVDGLQQKKVLQISQCDTPECLANTTNPVHLPTAPAPAPAPAIFPILKQLELYELPNLREICCSLVPAGSFGELTSIRVHNCESLENLFQLPIEGCLTRREEVHVATNNRIVFPKLEVLVLENLPRLVGFCRGIDQIDFPQLKRLELRRLGRINRLFHDNCNLSSKSEQNDNVGFLSLFPQEVSLPNLEVLELEKLQNLERLGRVPFSVGSFSKLKEFSVRYCAKLLCVFPSQLFSMLRELQELTVESCDSLEVVLELEGLESNEPNPEIFSPLKFVKLCFLPKLNCIAKRDPVGFKYIQTLEIHDCNSLRCVFAPAMTKSIPQLRELKISSCEMLSRIVGEENGLGESSVDEVEFPQLESLQLLDLPNLVSFFPNVKTSTLAKSIDHYHNPLQRQHLFNEKVAIPSLEYLELEGLQSVSDLWSSELPTSSFYKLKKLKMEGVVDWVEEILQKVKTSRCEMLSRIVADEIEFPQLESLKLLDLPNLVSFFPNVNTATLEKSTDHLHNPTQPQPLFNEKVAFPGLKYLGLSGLLKVSHLWGSELPTSSFSKLKTLSVRGFENLRSMFHPSMVAFPSLDYLGLSGLQNVSDLWGNELPTNSFSKLKNLQAIGCASLRNFSFISWIGDLNNTTQGLQVVAQLLYTNSGDGVLALGSDGTITPWMWDFSEHNPSGKATASVFPHQWQPASGLAMTNNVIGVNLEEAVPCMALSKNDSYLISACGGDVSVFNTMTFRVLKMFMPPPPASTFLALHPQEKTKIIAIGMEDSTICIYDVGKGVEVKSELKGHNKRITGLVFSTNLNILVSSGADAQLCVWSIDTWEKLKSIPIQLPAGMACNSDTRVQFHSDQIRLLVSHETQLAIYDASEMDCIRQWVPQDVLPAPISFATYSCDSQLVYTSFCDGNIGVFDADSLTLTCRIAPSAYSPALSSGGQAVYSRVVAAHPQKPNQFAIGLTNGFVIVMEPKESEGKWGLSPIVDDGMLNGRTASSSSKTSSHTPYQNRDGRMAKSMEKPRTLDDVTDKSKPWKVAETQCQLVGMPNSMDEAHKVAQLLFTNSGNGVLALGSNGTLTLWNRGFSQRSPSGKATASGFPHQWQPASGLAMTNDVIGVNLEEAVPCMALSKNDSYIISACGGKVSLFNRVTSRIVKKLLPPPPASTFLAFYHQDIIIAIGMEDSTICIYNAKEDEVMQELKGHKKRITGLAFSTNLNILVSSGADAQLCIWRLFSRKRLKSIPIQLPAGKACSGDTRVQFHSDQIHLLVSHETQLAIYDASKMNRIRQWVPQDVLPAPISFAAYSCDNQLVYTSFCDGNIGVFDADSLTLTCCIAPSAYSPTLSSGIQAVYPLVVATHPQKPNQFAIGLTNGSVIVIEPKESKGKWGLSPTIDNGMANDQVRR